MKCGQTNLPQLWRYFFSKYLCKYEEKSKTGATPFCTQAMKMSQPGASRKVRQFCSVLFLIFSHCNQIQNSKKKELLKYCSIWSDMLKFAQYNLCLLKKIAGSINTMPPNECFENKAKVVPPCQTEHSYV